MTPNIYAILKTRDVHQIYSGAAPQDAVAPFIVWQLISSAPHLSLSDIPSLDSQILQVDCYSPSQSEARSMAEDARDKIEAEHLHVTDISQRPQDPETRLYRWQLTVETQYAR